MGVAASHSRESGHGDSSQVPFFRHHVPRKPLSDFAALLWYYRGHEARRSTERVLPMGSMELVIRLGTGRAADAGISGPHSQAFLIERTIHDELLGVHFKPGGAFPFLGCAAGELHNRYVGLADLWGERHAGRVIARLNEARDVTSKFRVLEDALLDVMCRAPRHPAVEFALRAFRRDCALLSARDAARAVNLSQRRFIELFRDEVGLTPKLYSRILRFQRILGIIASADDVDWLDVALACGYFDQSHFIHDFREFTGLRPTEYLQLRIAGQANHVRVRD
jgi:AraC-like DNA-binding protein